MLTDSSCAAGGIGKRYHMSLLFITANKMSCTNWHFSCISNWNRFPHDYEKTIHHLCLPSTACPRSCLVAYFSNRKLFSCISIPEQQERLMTWIGRIVTYSMVQSPSWEANCFVASQEIPRISRNPKVHYRTHKRPPPVSILGQPNPVHIPTSHLLEIRPNIIHPSTPRSPQWSPSLRFPQQAVGRQCIKCSHDVCRNVQHRVIYLITSKAVKHNIKHKICFTPRSNFFPSELFSALINK